MRSGRRRGRLRRWLRHAIDLLEVGVGALRWSSAAGLMGFALALELNPLYLVVPQFSMMLDLMQARQWSGVAMTLGTLLVILPAGRARTGIAFMASLFYLFVTLGIYRGSGITPTLPAFTLFTIQTAWVWLRSGRPERR